MTKDQKEILEKIRKMHDDHQAELKRINWMFDAVIVLGAVFVFLWLIFKILQAIRGC